MGMLNDPTYQVTIGAQVLKKINPMIGAAGISAFPMSARVIHNMGQQEDQFNFLLMHAVSANVAGQIGSVIAGGLILALVV
jgi:oxaloacetate decarboxylase beta subunit